MAQASIPVWYEKHDSGGSVWVSVRDKYGEYWLCVYSTSLGNVRGELNVGEAGDRFSAGPSILVPDWN